METRVMALMDRPFLVSFVLLSLAAEIGNNLRIRFSPIEEDEREDFGIIVTATLTLLALLIGFTFSMAISRYDQRKNDEEAEANAIGTEYLRADLLPLRDVHHVKELLKEYLDQRILFYAVREQNALRQIDSDTSDVQRQLWAAVHLPTDNQSTILDALVVSGMNDVLNSQGYTQAAWLNRIPIAAWGLMGMMAVCASSLIGYRSRRRDWRIFIVVPLTVSITFFLICDIDSPRGGVILVAPQNLELLARSLAQS